MNHKPRLISIHQNCSAAYTVTKRDHKQALAHPAKKPLTGRLKILSTVYTPNFFAASQLHILEQFLFPALHVNVQHLVHDPEVVSINRLHFVHQAVFQFEQCTMLV